MSKFKVKVTRSKISVPMESLVTRNTHVKYESSTYTSSWVIGKVKVFVLAHVNANADADAGGTTIALRTFVPVS